MGPLSDENVGNFLKVKTEALNEDLVFSSDYADVCKYMCIVCNKSVDRLKTHMIAIHGQKASEVKISKKNFRTETYHKCGVCERVILFTKVRIRNHVAQSHNMSIREYDQQFMKPKIKNKKNIKVLNKNAKKKETKRQSSYLSLILLKINAYDETADESLLRDSYRDVCKVQCALCEKTIDLDLFSVHLSKKHDLSFSEYKVQNDIPLVTNRTFHKCGICGMVVLFTRVRISGHVTQKHGISIKEYSKKYLTKMNRGPANYEVNDTEVDRDVMYSNDYEDECKAVCKVCHKECSFANLNSHVYQCHNIRSGDYLTQFGSVEFSRKAYHECAICHKTLLFVRYHIATHVKTKHKISLNDYNREHMQFHNVEYSETNMGERGRQVGHQKAPKWCDGTNYRCPYCHNIYYRYFTFRIHLIRSHEVKDAEERSRVVRMNELVTDTYSCKICGQAIKKDRMDIEAHIKQVHKTTYRVYEENLESEQAGEDADAVVAKLIKEGVVAMPDKLPKKRGRNKRKGEEGVSPWMKAVALDNGVGGDIPKRRRNKTKEEKQVMAVPWKNPEASDNIWKTEDTSSRLKEAVDIITKIGDSASQNIEDSDSLELPATRRRRVPAKLASAEFEVGLITNHNVPSSLPPAKIKQSDQKQSPLKSKILSKIKSPLKATSSKLNKTNNNSNKFLVSDVRVKQEPNEPVETKTPLEGVPLTEVKKELEEVLMYKCPLPGCDWICTREGMRKGPAVLHLLRIHKIQPIEMRQRGIKFVTL